MRGLRAAGTLLTRVPVGGFPYSDADWRWAAAWVPLVGLLIGTASAAAWLATVRAGYVVAAIVAITVGLLLTGGLHEDGLADTADALGGGSSVPRERVLEILKDSRIGVYGSAALCVSILLRVALLARLGRGGASMLVLSSCAARVVPVWLMFALPYVTDVAVAKSRPVTTVGRAQLAVATCSVALVLAFARALQAVTTFEAIVLSLVLVLVAAGCGARFRARVGGITGDFLGAAEQCAECALLLALALCRGPAVS